MSDSTGAIDPPRRWWTIESWKRVAITLLATFALLGAFGWYLTPWFMAHGLRFVAPGAQMEIVPTDLPNISVAQLSQVRLSPPGYVLQLPVGNLNEGQDTRSGSVARYQSGRVVMAMKATSGGGFASQSRTLPDDRRRALIRLLGKDAMRSDYKVLSDALQTTPDEIRWWARTRNQKTDLLLSLKMLYIGNSQAVYRVGNSQVRGFEFVDSIKSPRLITLKLFDSADRQYEILVHEAKSGPPIPQADINAIIASIRPIPHS